MKTIVRAVRLRVLTASGAAGAQIEFDRGLNIVRGSNSRGKTQALQAIIYALGLEAMFGPSGSSGLGSAMTSEVLLPGAGNSPQEVPAAIISSWCAVELENESGSLTAQRPVVHPRLQKNLVRVFRAPALSAPSARHTATEYFVREQRSFQGEHGFHRLLAEFLGWNLPQVPRYTGGEAALYPEVVFPFFYADQRNWGSAGPRAVTHYQIREPTRHAVEFLLGFTANEARLRRQQLETELASLAADWRTKTESIQASASAVGTRLVGLPGSPAGVRRGGREELKPSDISQVRVEAIVENEWVPVEEVQRLLESTIMLSETIDSAVQAIDTNLVTSQLEDSEKELAEITAMAHAVDQAVTLNESQVAALDRRISALEDERSRNRDVKTLLRLGGSHPYSHLADSDCPTCHQSLAGSESQDLGPTLDVDQTLGVINAEIATARGMRGKASAASAQSRAVFSALQREVDRLRTTIRALRSDLIAPEDYPSAGAIARRIAAESRLQELARISDNLADKREEIQEIADRIADTRNSLERVPKDLPVEDTRKASQLGRLLRALLTQFGFSSYNARGVVLDEETLRPERAGFNLDADVSASDVVRVKIAYLEAIRELSNQVAGPHLGLLMLDEPRQHELDEDHFGATLARLAARAGDGEQTIVTSSTDRAALSGLLGTTAYVIRDLGRARLLQPEEPVDSLDL